MSHAPLPPHERAWRHPSELAAEMSVAIRSEPAPNTARLLAIVSGSVGVLAVGLLLLTATPRRADAPIAISATTSPGGQAPTRSLGVGLTFEGAPSATTPPNAPSAAAAATAQPPARLATPIGDGRQALMVRSERLAPGSEMDVQLVTGPMVTAVVATDLGDVVIVSITVDGAGHDVASEQPADDEIVTVLASPPITIAFAEVSGVEAADGTPVLDADGALVGLCAQSGHRTTLIDVTDRALAPAATTTADP